MRQCCSIWCADFVSLRFQVETFQVDGKEIHGNNNIKSASIYIDLHCDSHALLSKYCCDHESRRQYSLLMTDTINSCNVQFFSLFWNGVYSSAVCESLWFEAPRWIKNTRKKNGTTIAFIHEFGKRTSFIKCLYRLSLKWARRFGILSQRKWQTRIGINSTNVMWIAMMNHNKTWILRRNIKTKYQLSYAMLVIERNLITHNHDQVEIGHEFSLLTN